MDIERRERIGQLGMMREGPQHRMLVGILEDAPGPLTEEGPSLVREFFVLDLRQACGRIWREHFATSICMLGIFHASAIELSEGWPVVMRRGGFKSRPDPYLRSRAPFAQQ